MINISLHLEDDLNERFRQAIFQKFGLKRGNIKLALEESIEDWITKITLEVESNG